MKIFTEKIRNLRLAAAAAVIGISMLAPLSAQASGTYSDYWFQDQSGNWRVRDGAGNIVRSAWFCDDAVSANGKNVWYLLDSNGYLIPFGLVKDGSGNYYSMETNHNGYYGMLRYKSGTYDGIYLSLNQNHGGGFAAIQNQAGIDALKKKSGVLITNIDNTRCYYSSDFAEMAAQAAADPAGYSAASAAAEKEEQEQLSRLAAEFDAESYAKKVVELTNAEREKAGLSALTWNDRIVPVAKLRCEEAAHSFTHLRADGTHFWSAYDELGISDYIAVGENIAMGQKTPEAVVTAWMNSESHRENIMNSAFKEIAVSCCFNNGSICWAQEFFTQRSF